MSNRPPIYSIKDLAELLGVNPVTLHGRVANAPEQPPAAPFKTTKNHGASRQGVTLYDKAAFLAWHRKYYSHLEAGK